MEFILFLGAIGMISLFAVGRLLLYVMDDITRRNYLKRMDAKTRATMAPRDY